MTGVCLRGERVLLRPVSQGDAEVLARMVREPEVAAWWAPRDDFSGMLAVEHDGTLIGAIQYAERTARGARQAGIDVFLTARQHGRGLGTDAVRTLARWLLTARRADRLTIDPAAANHAAIRAYAKAGFTPVLLLRSPGPGEPDVLLMELRAGQGPAAPGPGRPAQRTGSGRDGV